MNARDLAVECVTAADEFIERRLWQKFANEDLIAFDVPDRELLLGSIMGAAGEEHGLLMFSGPRALTEFRKFMSRHDNRGADAVRSSTLLSASLTPAREVGEPFDRILKRAGRTGSVVPLFFAKEPGKQPRPPRRAELETLLYAMRGLLAADAIGRLRPEGSLASGILPVLRVSGEPARPGISIEVREVAEGEDRPLQPIDIPPDLASLPRSDATYLVGLPVMPASILGESDELRALLVLEPESGELHAMELVTGLDLDDAASHLFAVLRGAGKTSRPGLPARLLFDSEALFRVLGPGLRRLEIDCRCDQVPEIAELLDEFSHQTGITDELDPNAVPNHNDLAGWKAVDLRVTQRLADHAAIAFTAARPHKRYFGRSPDEYRVEPGPVGDSTMVGYIDWCVHRYRATKKSRTIAARVLAGNLSPAERELLEARDAAQASFYRITRIHPGDSLELFDLLTGRECQVTDKQLSLTATEGVTLIARVYAAGSFRFAMAIGPPLSPLATDSALAFLEQQIGVEIGEFIEPAASHLIGRLWGWVAEQQERLAMTNFDGEVLHWHMASFAVDDTAVLAAALEARDDVQVVEPGACWRWTKDRTLQGQLELLGDELLVEVNSRERAETARAWLGKIAGVRFVSVREKEVDPRIGNAAPLDDRLPGRHRDEAVPAEVVGQVQRHVRERCLQWLDEPIPALGGRTPREASATADGRRRVARLIRTYPDPRGTPGVSIPRDEMIAELGLAEASAEE